MAWNCRSLGSHEKKAWVKTFDGDVIALNETWGNTINLPGYLGYYKARTNQAEGGVAVLVKDHLHSTMLSDKIKDTLIVKILVGRSRMLFVVTSYFPCTTEIKWEKRFERIQVELSHHCEQYQFRNIVYIGDWNKDIEQDCRVREKLIQFGLEVADHSQIAWTYNTGSRYSKVDFAVKSSNLECERVLARRSISDHMALEIKIKNVNEIPRNKRG